jgi:hypothetical protein
VWKSCALRHHLAGCHAHVDSVRRGQPPETSCLPWGFDRISLGRLTYGGIRPSAKGDALVSDDNRTNPQQIGNPRFLQVSLVRLVLLTARERGSTALPRGDAVAFGMKTESLAAGHSPLSRRPGKGRLAWRRTVGRSPRHGRVAGSDRLAQSRGPAADDGRHRVPRGVEHEADRRRRRLATSPRKDGWTSTRMSAVTSLNSILKLTAAFGPGACCRTRRACGSPPCFSNRSPSPGSPECRRAVQRCGAKRLGSPPSGRKSPGTTYSYNNPGYNIVGALLEAVTGGNCFDVLRSVTYCLAA